MLSQNEASQEANGSEPSSEGEGGEGRSLSKLEQAEQLASRIDEGNKRYEELLDRQEKMMTDNVLAGRSEISGQPEKPKEETAKEYADRVMNNKLNEGKDDRE